MANINNIQNETNNNAGFPELLTVEEVSRILRIDDTTCRSYIRQGAIEAVVLPHLNKRMAYRIKRETLENVLNTPTNFPAA